MSSTSAYSLSIRLASFAQTVASSNATGGAKTADLASLLSRLLAKSETEANEIREKVACGFASWFGCEGGGKEGSWCVVDGAGGGGVGVGVGKKELDWVACTKVCSASSACSIRSDLATY